MAWVDLSAAFGYGTILTSTQMQNLRDNIVALRAGEEYMGRIKTGTYTGNGGSRDGDGDAQAIAGVGFRPRFVWIFVQPAAGGAEYHHVKLDQGWGDYVMAPSGTISFDDAINTLDADGFTVDDSNDDSHPNKNSQAYDYIAWG